ncbi:U3 small nucleolar ribonucleoprotein protein MPP10-like isoform X2 [Nerophis lumbriciformis]|uniref:U3 small nucleolar ribonucleoprotein protein MPP10-like isoform X2 n=1 Tax=Nerophis lumbriciformis TaxID=546530 RepID=UPI002ADF647D|nr:U3 small nucleolar ribonucleoprotein protein MPP10-like isoform X2 [Nerophis lumbriciformis]
MATTDMGVTLEESLNKLDVTTQHPEDFLSLQDAVATDYTSLTKTLYDLLKAQEPKVYNGSPLVQLVVKNFDEEQIWQELELQNSAVLKHFGNAVDDVLSDETVSVLLEEYIEEESGDKEEGEPVESMDEEAEEEPRSRLKKLSDCAAEDYTDDDSDLDFDVDALEKREKKKREPAGKHSEMKSRPSEVDDMFFKLSEMESFLDDMDKQEGKEHRDQNEVNYFQDLPSDEDDDLDLEKISLKKETKSTARSSRDLKYKEYFDAVDGAVVEADEKSDSEDEDGKEEMDEEEMDDEDDDGDLDEDLDENKNMNRESLKKVTFNLSGDEGSDGEDLQDIFGGKKTSPAKSESKSSYEKCQEKMSQKIDELEKAALGQKSWQLSGEVTARKRPENSMLEEDLDFEHASRKAPAITAETTLQLEDIIKQRIKDQAFDDVVRKEKPKEAVFEYKKRLTLDHEKSKQSLAEIYEQEYLKQTQQKAEEEENPAHVEIQKLMDTLFLKLDALSNFHFTPKPSVPEVKVVSNLPAVTMEEVAPVSASDGTLLAPEEIKEKNKAGDVVGVTEKTSTDKKRERRHKKKVKHFKIKEKEKKLKLKEASEAGNNQRLSKAQVKENLKKVTKGGKATILKDEGKDKALRSSQAFFSQLQDQVKSQIKSAKGQPPKKKRKEVSASKLKL